MNLKVTVPPPRPLKVPWMLPVAALALIAVVAFMIHLKNYADQLRSKEPFLQRPEDGKYVTDVVQSEDLCEEAMKSVEGTFLKGLKARDWAMVASGLADGFSARFPGPQEGDGVPDALVRIRQYSPARLRELDQDGFIKVLKSQIGGWASVDRAAWHAFEFLLDPGGKRAFVSAHFQVAGQRLDGGRSDLEATVQARVVLTGGRWKVKQLGLVSGWLAEADFKPFRDVTEQVGLSFHESAERAKVLQALIDARGIATRGGLTVADFNRDGFPDVLASAAHNDALLFLNDGKGAFVAQPVTSRPAECGACWLFVDLDNDGVEELVSSQVLRVEGEKAYGAIYRRNGETWELHPDALVFPVRPGERDLSIQGIVPFDLDGNGLLDLFFCVHSNRNSEGSKVSRVAAFDGADNFLMMNKGHLSFSEESDARGIKGTPYTYAARFWDFDADGDVDLFEGNAFGPGRLWLNDGKGRFTDAGKDHVFGADLHHTTGVTMADYDNTGSWAMNLSGVYSHAGSRILPLMFGVPEERRRKIGMLAAGNPFYEYSPQGRQWAERGVERGANEAGWAWGSVFWDPDNDGDKDLFVANGSTTHSDKDAPDYETHFWRQVAADARAAERKEDVPTPRAEAERKFRGSWSGGERDCEFHNPDGKSPRFYNTAYLFGLDFEDDGRAACPVDIDGDGDLDLVCLSLQGLRVMENLLPQKHFARFRLTAVNSNALALNAVVKVSAGGVTHQDFVKVIDGFMTQVPRELHFGLGSAAKIDQVIVQWPGAAPQRFLGLPVDRMIEITEGQDEARISEIPRWPEKASPGKVPAFQVRTDAASAIDLDALGDALLAHGELETAAEWLRRSIQADPDRATAHCRLGAACRGMAERIEAGTAPAASQEEEARRRGEALPKWVEAIEHLKRAVELEPDYADAQYNLGVACQRTGRNEEAIAPLQAALKAGGDSYETWTALGIAAGGAKQGALAAEAFEKAIELGPRKTAAWMGKAKWMRESGRADEAKKCLGKVLEIEPGNAEARGMLEGMGGR